MIALLASGWLAQALDARATEPQPHHVEIGTPYTLTISMGGECHDSSCNSGAAHEIPDLARSGPEVVVTLQIQPADSDAVFDLPFRVGGPFVPPVSGEIKVKLTDDLKSRIKKDAKDHCADFEVKHLSLTSVQPQDTRP